MLMAVSELNYALLDTAELHLPVGICSVCMLHLSTHYVQ